MYINIIDATILSNGIIKSFTKHLPNSIFYINGNYVGSEKNVIAANFENFENLKSIINEINQYKEATVIFHFMNSQKRFIINNLNQNIKVVWCIWGHDLYESNSSFINFSVYDTLTQKYINQNTTNVSAFKKRLRAVINRIKTKKTPKQHFLEFIKQVDAISYIVPLEESLIRNLGVIKPSLLLYHDPEYLEFTPIDEFEFNTKKNILIGNSGALSNNHLDAFDLIKNEDIEDRKIIVPLSYGGNKTYINYVINKGKEQFGDNFYPILDRLSLEEYSKLLESCGIVIFNHKRQQAVGNLLSLIGRGSKIIFHPENPVYKYYSSYGMNLDNTKDFTLDSLSMNKVVENQKIIKDIYNEDRLVDEFEKLKTI